MVRLEKIQIIDRFENLTPFFRQLFKRKGAETQRVALGFKTCRRFIFLKWSLCASAPLRLINCSSENSRI
jgi:hypothetical protein